MACDGERLRRLLGGPELADLRRRLRARYERGESRDEFTLARLEPLERRAIAGLLGRPTMSASSMHMCHSDLDRALMRAGIAGTLREALEFLDGPLHDRKAARIAREEAWSVALSRAEAPQLEALLSGGAGAALVKRLSGSDPTRARSLLGEAARVLERLPGRGISLAQLAAEVLGDSHALDAGHPVATIVLRACAGETAPEAAGTSGDPDESPRERWARLGVTVNELALPALSLNLPVRAGANAVLGLTQETLPRFATLTSCLSLPGEPVHLSLRRLLRHPPDWDVVGHDVFICENPNIVAIAADRLGALCAPLVCTDGMPSAAQQALLAQLAASGARLRYHGDFDWAGLAIGNFVMREFGAEPWRFQTADYLSACAGRGAELRGDGRVVARWDDRLTGMMAEQKAVVHEEAVVETLLRDLAIVLP
jgi:uncharacterized protein (TIGR02679 family)